MSSPQCQPPKVFCSCGSCSSERQFRLLRQKNKNQTKLNQAGSWYLSLKICKPPWAPPRRAARKTGSQDPGRGEKKGSRRLERAKTLNYGQQWSHLHSWWSEGLFHRSAPCGAGSPHPGGLALKEWRPVTIQGYSRRLLGSLSTGELSQRAARCVFLFLISSQGQLSWLIPSTLLGASCF